MTLEELKRLRAIENAAKRWAAAHALHHPSTTITEKDAGRCMTRRQFLEIESALLNAVRR